MNKLSKNFRSNTITVETMEERCACLCNCGKCVAGAIQSQVDSYAVAYEVAVWSYYYGG